MSSRLFVGSLESFENTEALYPKMLVIVSSPSGGGKSTICRMLLGDKASPLFGGSRFSISATTRAARNGEVDGVHYHFLDRGEFESKIRDGCFLEHAYVFGNLYGTLYSEIVVDKHTVFDIDYQGQSQIISNLKNKYGDRVRCVSIFLVPPSLDELRRRLLNRQDISQNEIDERSKFIKDEVESSANYDYVVPNVDLNKTFEDICRIIEVELYRFKARFIDFSNYQSVIDMSLKLYND